MAKKDRPEEAGSRGIDPAGFLDSTSSWRKGLIVTLFLVLILAILMPEIIFQNKIFLVPDTKAPISFSEVGKKALEAGTYPLWNPYIFCGMPSYPSLSYTPYVYPVAYVTYILQNYLRFPEMTWLLIHYLMAGIGVYLLLRSFGVRSSISLLGGMIFMIMPNYVANGANGHGSQACAVAYMPFALLFCRNIMKGRLRLLNAGLLAVALGFQMLRGHVQISYYTFLVTGLFFLFEAVYLLKKGEYRAVLADLAFLAGSMFLALGIASVLILPVREYADYSIRGGSGGGLDYDYATGWSLHPKEVLTFIFPWASGFGKSTYWGQMPFTDYPNYLGIITAFFSIFALFVRRTRWKWYIFIASVLATFISFGRHMPLFYDPLFRFLPYFNKFRVPVMILIVQQLLAVTLMGIGIEDFIRLREEGRRLPSILEQNKLKWVLISVIVIILFALVGSSGIRDSIQNSSVVRGRVRAEWIRIASSGFAADLVRTLFVLLALLAVIFVTSWKKLAAGTVVLLLAAVAFFDMYTVDHPLLYPEKSWNNPGYRIIKPVSAREAFKEENAILRYLPDDDSLFRIFPVPAARPGSWSHNVFPFSDNSYMMSGIYSMGGYHAAKLKNYQNVMDLMFATFNRGTVPAQILNMLGAKYFVSLYPVFPEGSVYKTIHEQERNYIYINPDALPRVFFVDKMKVMPSEDALQHLVSPTFDPSREVLLQKVPAGTIESAEGSSAEIIDYSLNSITVKANVEKPCLMVLSEIDYPDWKARVDGEEVEILTADYCLRSIALGAGEHEIVFSYTSTVLKRSLVISISALVLSVIAMILSLAAKKRKGN